MKCDTVRDELAIMALGEATTLPPPFLEHLTECADCSKAYRRYLEVSERLISAAPTLEPPPDLRAKVLAQAQTSSNASTGGSSTQETNQSGFRRWWTHVPSGAAAGVWATVAMLLVALNIGLVWQNTSIKSRLSEVEARLATGEREVVETWRAFATAPAILAGRFNFARSSLEGGQSPGGKIDARGLVYQRPGGWAALIRVEGLRQTGVETYHAWFRDGENWTDGGALFVDEKGVGTLIYYAREDDIGLESVTIVKGGVNPGEEGWSRQTVVKGRAILTADDTNPPHGPLEDW